ncbi:MAG: MFS transporter [Halobacteria archaeon]
MALAVLCIGMLMMVLDITIVNVALPSIQRDLGFSQASLSWVVNAYLLTFGGFLLLAGRLGDLVGRKSVFIAGLVVFTVASLLCGLADSQGLLIAARALQGAGGALVSAVTLAILVTSFPEPGEQARAMGVFSFFASAGGSVGLLMGGVLTQSINWHWIFFVNLPIGAVTVLLASALIPRDPGTGLRGGVDLPGVLLVIAAPMLGVYAIVQAGESGWGSAPTLGFGLGALALLAAFVLVESRVPNPLVPLRIFRSRDLAGANLVMVSLSTGMFGSFFLLTLYLQGVLGYDALGTGLAFLPVAVLIGLFSVGLTARLMTRFGAKATLVPGLALIAAGLVLFARVPVGGQFAADLLPGMLLFGVGAGLAFMPLMMLAMSGVAPGDSGLASGLVQVMGQMGGAFGLTVLASAAAWRSADLLAGGSSRAEAFTAGYHLAFAIAAGCVAAGVVLSLFLLRSDRARHGPVPDSGGEAAVGK